MDAVLHRIEALPGHGRYAVTFARPDGAEQTATMQVADGQIEVAEASLPSGWQRGSDAFRSSADAVLAFHAARAHVTAATLRDVPGGWDVSLGNVVLDESGAPRCTAHGVMEVAGDVYTCPECGATAMIA
jgi:ribosomal protein S27AE